MEIFAVKVTYFGTELANLIRDHQPTVNPSAKPNKNDPKNDRFKKMFMKKFGGSQVLNKKCSAAWGDSPG